MGLDVSLQALYPSLKSEERVDGVRPAVPWKTHLRPLLNGQPRGDLSSFMQVHLPFYISAVSDLVRFLSFIYAQRCICPCKTGLVSNLT